MWKEKVFKPTAQMMLNGDGVNKFVITAERNMLDFFNEHNVREFKILRISNYEQEDTIGVQKEIQTVYYDKYAQKLKDE